jgi:hypothetical protein
MLSSEFSPIPQADIDRANRNIVDVVSEFIELKKAGPEYIACCPFHTEKSPSFKVSPAKGFYYCFGCGASGDAVSFVMEFKGLNFPEAVRYINGEPVRPVVRPRLPIEQRQSLVAKITPVKTYEHIIPVPEGAEPLPAAHSRHGRPSMRWPVLQQDGALMGYPGRVITNKAVFECFGGRNFQGHYRRDFIELSCALHVLPRQYTGRYQAAGRPGATDGVGVALQA